jgi:hypothetical protein
MQMIEPERVVAAIGCVMGDGALFSSPAV